MPRSLKIKYLPEAAADLARLRSFVEIHDAKAAAHAARKIVETVERLCIYPLVGRPTAVFAALPTRDLFIHFGQGGYWLRYAVTDDKIYIIRIWHGREEINP